MKATIRDFEIAGSVYRIYLNGATPDRKSLYAEGFVRETNLSDGHLAGTELVRLFKGMSTPVYRKDK